MTVRMAIVSCLQLFALLAFVLGGIFFIALPFLPEVRFRFAEVLLHHEEVCGSIALGFFSAAFLLTFGFYALSRRKFLRLRMGVSIHQGLIGETLERFFTQHFPGRVKLLHLEIDAKKRLRIHLQSRSPSFPYEQMEPELQALLLRRFGYTSPFDLIISHPSTS